MVRASWPEQLQLSCEATDQELWFVGIFGQCDKR